MEDTIEVTLPVTGKKVVIRNYTTRADDAASERVLYNGVDAKQSGTDQEITFPIENIMSSQSVYIPRLVLSVDGNEDNIGKQLEDLRTEDYDVVEKAVEGVVNEHSPKAKGAGNASKATTPTK